MDFSNVDFSKTIDVLVNISASMKPVQHLITGAAYLLGISFAIKAIYTLKSYGESRAAMSGGHSGMKEPAIYLLVAAILIYIPSGMSMIMTTVFNRPSPLQYSSLSSDAIFGFNSEEGRALVLIIQTIGVVAFVRGWVLVARSAGHGQQPGGAGKGLMHVFGGILAVNIVGTIKIINNTLF